VRKKGFDVLVDAAVEVARRGRLRAEVLIIGSGPEERFLRKRARDAPSCVEIKFAGAANNDEVDRSMSEADIFVLPLRVTETGDRDGIPVVLMEAMAHALPVISGDLVAIRELIEDGENGLLIPCGSVASLVLAIESIGNDIELRRKLGCAARKTVESEFDLSANALRMYDALCGRRPPG
jgi:glycosyltransferase involved in cell wall biosynthesis